MLRVKQYAAGMSQSFGDVLREKRTAMGLSQRAMADRLAANGIPVDSTAIARMETGQRDPRLSEALALADFLSIDLTLIEYGDGRMVYLGYIESAVHDFYAARRHLRRCIQSASFAAEESRKRDGEDDWSDRSATVFAELVGDEQRWSEPAELPLYAADPGIARNILESLIDGILEPKIVDRGSPS